MSEVETRALRRAAVVLIALSVARWGSARRPGPPGPAPSDSLVAHADAVRAATEEAARRATPLEAGETLDPNRADEAELDRLPGVGPATARAIVEARESGIVFRRPEDLAAVAGIGPATVERVRGLLDLGDLPPRRADPTRAPAPVDLNRAAVDELVLLPGIGPVLAARIAEERRRSAFSSLDDLVRVPGIGPATVERLRGRAVVR